MARYTIRELNQFGHKTAREIALAQGTPRKPHRAYGSMIHPRCSEPGCSNERAVQDWHWTSGEPVYRTVCSQCHQQRTAKRYAEKTGADWIRNIDDVVAHKAGFTSHADYVNSRHPYRQYRKDHCENQDGRLGFVCTTTIAWSGMLDVDHIDENPSNDNPSNFQTLCKCCHAYKGNQFVKEHGRTPGRITLGITRH